MRLALIRAGVVLLSLAVLALPGSQADAGPSSAPQLSSPDVTSEYLGVLCRTPDPGAIAYWLSEVSSVPELHGRLATSDEGQRIRDVRYAYLTALGRDPIGDDCGGLRGWAESGLGTDDIRAGLWSSAEGQRVQEVRAAFLDAVGRDPLGNDNASLRHWMGSPAAGSDLRRQIAEVRPAVGIHYFPWYTAMPGGWGNGNTLVRTDVGRPIAGYYDSGDERVIARHIQQIEDAGFDFIILNVPTQQPRVTANTDKVFDALKGRRLKAVLMLDDLYKASAETKTRAVAEIATRYAGRPEYYTQDGAAHVYLFASPIDFEVPNIRLQNVYWSRAFEQGRNTFNEHAFLQSEDVPFWYAWPQPLVNGVVPVIPGYTDVHLNRDFSMEHERLAGALYRQQWERALELKPHTIMVYSWNEHFEETGIEPTSVWGDLYLKLTTCYVRRAHQASQDTCP